MSVLYNISHIRRVTYSAIFFLRLLSLAATMPSDLAKKKAAKKKEAAKSRQRVKRTDEVNGVEEHQENQPNATVNGGGYSATSIL